jgi:hypothetical protein
LVEENSLIEYDGEDVGPSKVVKEHLKCVKKLVIPRKVKTGICAPPVCCIEIVYI